MHTAYLLLGSNLGNRQEMLDEARRLLSKRCGMLAAVSTVAQTDPCGLFAQGDAPQPFLNQVICIKTFFNLQKFMAECLAVEEALGRDRSLPVQDAEGRRVFRSRSIDIDILLYDNRVCDLPAVGALPAVRVPHPQIVERPFVLPLLRELLPDYEPAKE